MNHHTNEVRRIVANLHHIIVDREAEQRLYPWSRETRLFIAGVASRSHCRTSERSLIAARECVAVGRVLISIVMQVFGFHR